MFSKCISFNGNIDFGFSICLIDSCCNSCNSVATIESQVTKECRHIEALHGGLSVSSGVDVLYKGLSECRPENPSHCVCDSVMQSCSEMSHLGRRLIVSDSHTHPGPHEYQTRQEQRTVPFSENNCDIVKYVIKCVTTS